MSDRRTDGVDRRADWLTDGEETYSLPGFTDRGIIKVKEKDAYILYRWIYELQWQFKKSSKMTRTAVSVSRISQLTCNTNLSAYSFKTHWPDRYKVKGKFQCQEECIVHALVMRVCDRHSSDTFRANWILLKEFVYINKHLLKYISKEWIFSIKIFRVKIVGNCYFVGLLHHTFGFSLFWHFWDITSTFLAKDRWRECITRNAHNYSPY